MVENTRFEDVDGKKESKNDEELGKYWASLGDGIFVNDAFGTAHRAHASNVGISANVEKAVAGFLLENEIAYIQEAVETPERPFVAILGGSKVSDKIGVIENLLEKADKVLIGGGMTYTFYKAQGIEIGNSLVEEDKLDVAKDLLEKSNGKLILPVDSKEANAFAGYTEVRDTEGEAVSEGFLGLDIGPKSIAEFDQALTGAKTVVWNGPMGVFETLTSKLVQSVSWTLSLNNQALNPSSVVVIQQLLLSTLAVLTNSHGSVLAEALAWNFSRVKYYQVWQH